MGARVTRDVVERLLLRAVEGGLDGLRQAPLVDHRVLYPDLQAGALAEPVRQELQRRHQAELVEDGRPQFMGQAAQLLAYLVKVGGDALDMAPDRLRRDFP